MAGGHRDDQRAAVGVALVTLVWLGSHEMLAGRLTVGQLISFVGYAVFMLWPLQTFFEFAQKWVQGLVSARKTIALLAAEVPFTQGADPLPPRPRLEDAASGLVVEPGRFLAVVSAVPEDSAALADRLGRYLPAQQAEGEDAEAPELTGRAARRALSEREARRAAAALADAAVASGDWGVRADGVDYSRLTLASLRRTVVVSDTGSQLFAGTLQQAVDPWGNHSGSRPTRCCAASPTMSSLACPAGGRDESMSWAAASPVASGNGSCWPGRCSWTLRFSCSWNRRRPWTSSPKRPSPNGWPSSAAAGPRW